MRPVFQAIIALDPLGRAAMQRDMEVVREIVRQIQAKNTLNPARIEIDGQEEWIVARHLEILMQAGLIDGVISRPIGRAYPSVLVKDMSWAGHDFAAVVLNDTVWGKIKQKLSPSELATAPLALIGTIGTKLLEAYLLNKTGLT
jgi:hypothetical protein